MRRVISKQAVKVGPMIASGGFSDIFQANYNGKEYALKQFKWPMEEEIYENVRKLTQKEFAECFVVPKFIVGVNKRMYLMELCKGKDIILDIKSLNDRIMYLKQFRDILEKLHKEYRLVHGDIHMGNFLLDSELKKAYLIDFDTANKENTDVSNLDRCFSSFAKNYIKNYGFNFGLDIYLLNFITHYLLTGEYYNYGFLDRRFLPDEKVDKSYNSRKMKEARKILLLDDIQKTYPNEYLIDYL